jgi:spore germination cell wall hydrolase CwlJ-like protein
MSLPYKLIGIVVIGLVSNIARSAVGTDQFVPFLDTDTTITDAPEQETPKRATFTYAQWEFISLDKEIECLAKNLYFEAWQEERKGQLAVALVTINRVKSGFYPNSICKVVWQITKNRRGKRVAQFSWTLDGKADVPGNETAWSEMLNLAREILANGSLDNIPDFTEGATHYHAVYVRPKWRKSMDKVMKIGLHIFYRDPKLVVDLTT